MEVTTSRILTIRGRSEIEDFADLSRWAKSFLVVDEAYRLIKHPDLLRRGTKIDFRTKDLREIDGARLASFRVSSPYEIVVPADTAWIGALIFVLTNYKTVKENVKEIYDDAEKILASINGLTRREIQDINIGIRLFRDHLLKLAKDDARGFLHRVQNARARLNCESIESIQVDKNST